jgi:hypothetical protein
MKKMIAVVALGALVASVAMAMSSGGEEQIDPSVVDAKIDGRLHDLLVAARMAHHHR